MAATQARALYDFDSDDTGELSFAANELLTILRQDIGDGWWEACNARGVKGLIPEAYVEILEEPVSPDPEEEVIAKVKPAEVQKPKVSSLPEPTMPPPPPPTTYLQNNSQPSSSPSWQQPSAPPRASWTEPAPSTPSWQPPPPQNHQPPSQSSALKNQDSYEDWDDDWDDDDSSTTTETPGMGEGGQGSKDKDGKFGTVRKPFNRFSAFTKQGGEQYLFGTATVVPDSEKKAIVYETPDGPMWKSIDPFTCVVASPKKESKFHGMKSFIAYQVTPSFSNIQVSRRYKHFDWLHERMVEKFSTICVPPLPDKQIAGRYEDEFITERMRQLQCWMDRMCLHPTVAHSEVFHHFLTCTDEKRWKVGKRKAEKDEYQGGKFFMTVQTPATPLDQKQVDSTIERFSRFVKSMDDSVKHLFATGQNNMNKHQGPFKKEYCKIGGSFISLAKSFEFDERPVAQNLTKAINHSGQTYEDIGRLFEDQPRNDLLPLLEGLAEYKGMLSTFPDTLSVHRAASQKMEESYARLTESEQQAVQGRLEVISYVTMAEMNHFQQHRVGDFKRYMQNYLTNQIEFYKKITQRLETTLAQYDQA